MKNIMCAVYLWRDGSSVTDALQSTCVNSQSFELFYRGAEQADYGLPEDVTIDAFGR